MIHHQMLSKAQFRQIIKQITFVIGWLIKSGMRRLTTAGVQQTNGRRAAVRRTGIKVFKQNVKVRP
ncbi:Uncharacterised protein [Salmonella enterica subsp. enterica serovar Bovismorbificans]|nr:Uncharacterised protein [Salmonella enterica subsp. enterica serovar Bovismorbificans]